MKIGVAKEIKSDEYRVALTPAGARRLLRHAEHQRDLGVPVLLDDAQLDGAPLVLGKRGHRVVQRGHEVTVETGAGAGSSFPDDAYTAAGAELASVEDVWADSELLLKVKEPIEPEYGRLREGLVLFTYLHIAADEPLTRALVDSGITGVA